MMTLQEMLDIARDAEPTKALTQQLIMEAFEAGKRKTKSGFLNMCHWTEDKNGHWDTECGEEAYYFEDGSMENSGFNYCPFCGGELIAVRYEES